MKNNFVKVNLAKSAGFCFGVRRALTIAFETARLRVPVYMLGDIVHNEGVVCSIKKAGIKKIRSLRNGKNKTLLIRAHGASTDTINKARASGYSIVDATCPMVKEIHRIVREIERRGYTVIIIGDKQHDEVHGIIGQLKTKAIVIDGPRRLPAKTLQKARKAGIVVQSTQNQEKVLTIVKKLRKYIGQVICFNTICKPTRMKQEEIKRMPLQNDVMIVIGSKTSANTRRLYELAKSLNPHTYWVQSKRDIKPTWLRDVSAVGVTSGASTPDETTQAVVACIRKLAKKP